MKQLGTVWLHGLCCSRAHAKPCMSALLKITRIQQNETNTISKSRCFLLDLLICNPTMPIRSTLMFSLLQALQGHARAPARSHYAEHCCFSGFSGHSLVDFALPAPQNEGLPSVSGCA